MKEIQLYGRHLLREQMIAAFEHEGVAVRTFADLEMLCREGNREIPVIVWTTDNRHAVLAAVRLRRAGFRPHRYWIGGDVLRLVRTSRVRRNLLCVGNRFFLSHTANAGWLADELAGAGIAASSLPISPACCAEHWSMPPAPAAPYTVLYYSQANADAIYLPGVMLTAAAALPAVRFVTIGNSEFTGGPGNVEHRGVVSPEECRGLYAQANALLRFTSHDGLSRMVLEAMSCGLDVLFTHEVPYAHSVTSAGEVIAALQRLSAQSPGRNIAARDYVLQQFSAKSWTEGWRRRLGIWDEGT